MATQPSNTPLIPAPVDFTAADFDTCLAAIQKAVAAAFPKWTDFNRASAGNILLQSFCYVLDIMRFYQNNQALETFFATVQRRRNLVALASGLGLKLKGISAATVDVEFTLGSAQANNVVIPSGTQVSTAGQQNTVVTFFTTQALTILAGNTQGTVSARNARARTEQLQSDGSPSQLFKLSRAPAIDGSAVVTIASEVWVEVPNFFNSGPTSKHYVTFIDDNDNMSIVFGNGVNGFIPPLGTIGVDYLTGGGVDGNVAADTLTELSSAIFDTAGNQVATVVTNPNAASGGSDRESLEQARRRLPGALRALTRTVSREDFEINALGVPGVARTMMLTTDEDATVTDNEGDLIIIPDGGGLPSAALKAKVLAEVTVVFPTMITFKVNVEDPTYKTIDVTCDVKVKNGFTQSQVEANINAALTAFFAITDSDGSPNPSVDFGANELDQVVAFSDIFNAVRDATGVDRVKKSTFLPADNVALTLREFPELGTVTVNFL